MEITTKTYNLRKLWDEIEEGSSTDKFFTRLNKLTFPKGEMGSLLCYPNSDTLAIVAYHENKIVGWCSLYCWRDRKNRELDCIEKTVNFGVYVEPKHRRQGIGSTLLQRAKRVAGPGRQVNVFPHDPKSRNFFYKYRGRKLKTW